MKKAFKNHDARIENNEKAARRRFESKELINRIKLGPCDRCGNRFLPCQMDFIKIDEGVESPSKILLMSKKRILDNISKCMLLCANCSRLVLWERQREKRKQLL